MKVKFLAKLLLVSIKLIQFSDGACRLQASVRRVVGEKNETLHQTQLQLKCDSDSCPPTNFITCDTHADLGISGECSGEQCTRIFNLCGNSCINGNQDLRLIDVSLNPNYPGPLPTTIFYSVTRTSTIPCTLATTFTETRDFDCSTTTIPCALATTVQNMLTTTVWNHCALSTILSTTTKIDKETTTILFQCKTTSTKHIETKISSVLQTRTCTQPKWSEVTTEKVDCSPGTSSALEAFIGILIFLLILVIIGWVWTCWTKSKKISELLTQNIRQTNSDINITGTDLYLSNNPAYENNMQVNINPAYEGSTLPTGEIEQPSTPEPEYEIIPPATKNI